MAWQQRGALGDGEAALGGALGGDLGVSPASWTSAARNTARADAPSAYANLFAGGLDDDFSELLAIEEEAASRDMSEEQGAAAQAAPQGRAPARAPVAAEPTWRAVFADSRGAGGRRRPVLDAADMRLHRKDSLHRR